MRLFELFKARKCAKTQITEKVADQSFQQNRNMWRCTCGRENCDYVTTCVCGVHKRNIKVCEKKAEITKEDKLIFVLETQYVDEKDFMHYSKNTYFRTTQDEIIKKTSSTIADGHNAARNSNYECSYKISLDELNTDMQAFDHKLGTMKKSDFNGSLVGVLAVHYKEGFGFEKTLERKAVLYADNKYYLQQIIGSVTAEANGRPVTQYNEYVYLINADNIDEITPENIKEYIVWEYIYQDIRSVEGVEF